jgi:hypothetical protein
VAQVYAHGPDSVGTVIVRDPAVIHLGRREDLGLGAHRVLMVGRTDLSEVADSLKTYDPAYAHRMAQEMFGTTVEWTVPVLEGLEDFAREFSVPVLETAYPLVVDGRWTAHRPMPATTGPGPAIIARRVGTAPEDWPTEEDFSRAYPVDDSVDVRMLGSESSVLTRTGREVLPPSWIVFDEDEIDPVIFWRAVDFMVQVDRRGRSRGHDRDVLEAMAAGTVVIGGPGYDRLYGDRITTAAPEQIATVIADLRQDPEGYLRRATAGQDYVRDEHNAEKFARFVERYAGIEMGMTV